MNTAPAQPQPGMRQVAILLGVVVAILLGWVLHVAASILQPLVIALLLAGMLQPVVLWLKRFHVPPALTVVALVLLTFFGLARLGLLLRDNVLVFFGEQPPPAGAELDPLAHQQLPPAAPESSRQAGVQAPAGWGEVLGRIEERIRGSRLPPPLAEMLVESIEGLDRPGLATGLLGGGLGFLRGLTLVVIYMLFIFAEAAVFRRKILAIAGRRSHEAAEVLDRISQGIQRYLGVKTVVSLATGGLCYLGLLWIGVPFALLFAFLAFLLNYIPTFGSIIASLFPAATALAVDGPGAAVLVLALYLAVNLTLGSYLEPKILGRELDLSPLVVIVSVVVWAGLWGVVGTFLAVPLTASLVIIFAGMESTRPVALVLSSWPPREERFQARLARRRQRRAERDD